MSMDDPYLSVKDLRELLRDPNLREDDTICTITRASTGNLPIARGRQVIGLIWVNREVTGRSEIEWYEDE